MSANAVTIKINDRAKSLRFAESMTSGSIYQLTLDGATIASGSVAIFTHCKKLVAYANITNSQGTLSTNTVELYEHIKSSPIGATFPLKVIVHKAGEEEYENVAIGDCFIINAGGTWSDNTTGIEAYTKAETDAKLATKADLSHTHDRSDISGLEEALAGKAAASHTHDQSDISGLEEALAAKADEEHTHAQADIAGLDAALAAKADAATVNAELANKSSVSHTHPTVAPSTDADDTALAGAKSTAEFVNSSINNLAAFYITADEDGNAFATKAQLDSATKFYNSGEERIPTKNDYLIVLEDETHTTSAGFNPTTRYVYDGAQWAFQYVVNNTSLTQAQLDAINSGITSAKVAKIKDTDNNVTQTSPNPVKASGIWSWVKSLLPAWLTSNYAEPATTESVATKLPKADVINPASATTAGKAADALDVKNALANKNGTARPLPDYLYALDFADSYKAEAEAFYEEIADDTNAFGCSAVRRGNNLFRNYDWTFDDAAEFVVRMSGNASRFASVGVASVGKKLTDAFVKSGKWSRYYKALPGMTLDGINEKGVVAEINVDGGPKTGWHGTGANAIHILAAVRWVLDNGETAAQAAQYLAENVKQPTGDLNFHFMIADATSTYIVENGVAHEVTNTTKVLTNYAIFGTGGGGTERYNLLASGGDITDAWFTKAYQSGNTWHSDFASEAEHASAITQWAAQGETKEAHRNKTTSGGKAWWQTVHTSVYDFTNKTLKVAVQETDDWYTFALIGSGAASTDWSAITNKPTAFPPEAHTHANDNWFTTAVNAVKTWAQGLFLPKSGGVATGTIQANASVYLYGVQSTLAFILDAAMENWLMFMWNGNTLMTQGTVPLVFTNTVAFYGGLKIGNDDVATQAYVDAAVANAGWGYNGEINMTDAISIYNAQAGKNYYRAAEGDKYIKLPSGVQNISFVITHDAVAGNTYITTDDEVVLATDTTSGFKTMLLTNGSSNNWMVTIRKVNPILLFVKKERILAA